MTAKANKMMEHDPVGQPAVEKHAPKIGRQHHLPPRAATSIRRFAGKGVLLYI